MATQARRARNLFMILGMPRSGTTWIGKMLDSSPDTLYLHEPDNGSLSRSLPIFFTSQEIQKDHERRVNAFFSGLPENAPLRCVVRLPLFRKTFYEDLDWAKLKFMAYVEKVLPKLGSTLRFGQILSVPEDVPLVIKSVESFGRIPVFRKVLGGFKLLYILRHPCAVYHSIIRGESAGRFRDNNPVTRSTPRLRQLLSCERASAYDLSYEKLMSMTEAKRFAYWWVVANEEALNLCEDSPNAMVIVYEEVCGHSLREARNIYHYLGLKFSKRVEDNILLMSKKHETRYYSVFKNAGKTRDSWKSSLRKEDSEDIQRILSQSPLSRYWNHGR